MKKLPIVFLAIIIIAVACKKPGEQEPTALTVGKDLTLPAPQLNEEQMIQVKRLNNDAKLYDYAKACNEVFLRIIPGSSQATVQSLARIYLQPRVNELRASYANSILKRVDAEKILSASLTAQLSKLSRIDHEKFFSPDPCRAGFENSTRKCQDDFFADLPGCGAVALASTVFGPEIGFICVAGLGLRAMACRNSAQRDYIHCMEKVLHPGDDVYFQKDTFLRGQKFRIGTSIGVANKSLSQFLEEREALKNRWENMTFKQWLPHRILTVGSMPKIKFP